MSEQGIVEGAWTSGPPARERTRGAGGGDRASAEHHDRDRGRPAEPSGLSIDDADRVCAWVDYRKDYGVSAQHMTAARKAFMAGWMAAREGDQSGVLR